MQIAARSTAFKPMALPQLSVRITLLAAAALVVFLMIGGSAGADIPEVPPIEYVVEAGDSLWSIAAAHAEPGADIRRLVSEIRQASGGVGDHIVPGDVLLIPSG